MQVYIYILGCHLFIYYSWYTSNFEPTYAKPPFIQVVIFFWCSPSIKLSWMQRGSNKINTMLYDRYYLQNCNTITFEKIAYQTKKKPNVPSHLHIFCLSFDKTFHHPFLLLGQTDFWENTAWKSYFLQPGTWWQELEGKFCVWESMSENASNQCMF